MKKLYLHQYFLTALRKCLIQILGCKVKVKTSYIYSGTVSFTATSGFVCSTSLCPAAVLIAAIPLLICHPHSPEVGNGLSWPKPQCTCNAMVRYYSHTQYRTNQGVLRSISACLINIILKSNDLRPPRRGIEPRRSN